MGNVLSPTDCRRGRWICRVLIRSGFRKPRLVAVGKAGSEHGSSRAPITRPGSALSSLPAVPASRAAGDSVRAARKSEADMLRGVACPPQHRPGIARQGSDQRPPHDPCGDRASTRTARRAHNAARATRSTEARMLSTVPLYRVGTNPTERHNSITNWLNSGARSSSDSSRGSAASVATGISAYIGQGGAPQRQAPRADPAGTTPTPPSTEPVKRARAPHPAARPPAAGTAPAHRSRPGGSRGRRAAAGPRGGSTASSRSWRRRPPPADWASTGRRAVRPSAARSTWARICRASIRKVPPGCAQLHVMGGALQKDHPELCFQALNRWLSADWTMCSRAAARPKCNSSARVTK